MTVNLTRIYTRLGDGGETHLGDMSRVPKTHPRIAAYGTVDELGAQIGVALTVEGLKKRGALVFSVARAGGIPVMVSYAGGYARRIEDTVTIHCNTVIAAKEVLAKASGTP